MSDGPAIEMTRLIDGVLDILAAGTPMPRHFDRLARDCKLPEGVPTIVFLTGLKRVLADLPEKAFDDRQIRMATLDAVQAALDEAIDQEEARLESESQHQEG
ncbi:TyeA family type III secretion system gatekeeper subunit [Variovorax soli]|uniref:Type III secretion system TyeA family effector delivery regulator n=1 Tax=Variovorax soli TaxID=376815 RepID=A0ABU1NEW1_9BURK|nr:TyeA family type III secretion system gatekeeper subunit [Variovorax soli]MDR6536946.1 type III secretion system TyeA family effector delivery regulator [Variovorax soli]